MAKKVKKAAPKKAAKKKVAKPTAKKAPAKKKAAVVAKKKKAAGKTVRPTPKAAKKAEKKKATTAGRKETGSTAIPKTVPPELNIFPVLNQRPIAHQPQNKTSVESSKSRYNDEELKEFEDLILGKLNKAKEEYRILKETLNRENDSGTDSTSGGNTKVLEDGAETAEKENLSQLAARQQKYITNLENALIRIKNGTYGICSVTGKLIPKERLIAVPHTTQSIEAKMMKKD